MSDQRYKVGVMYNGKPAFVLRGAEVHRRELRPPGGVTANVLFTTDAGDQLLIEIAQEPPK